MLWKRLWNLQDFVLHTTIQWGTIVHNARGGYAIQIGFYSLSFHRLNHNPDCGMFLKVWVNIVFRTALTFWSLIWLAYLVNVCWKNWNCGRLAQKSFRTQLFHPHLKVVSPTTWGRFAQSHYIHNSSRFPKVGNFVKLHESICNLFFVEYLKYTAMDIILYLIREVTVSNGHFVWTLLYPVLNIPGGYWICFRGSEIHGCIFWTFVNVTIKGGKKYHT